MPERSANETDKQKLFPKRPGIRWEVNSEMDILDHEQWYRAKIVEINDEQQLVKVHFHKWAPRFDRWLHMQSPDIRPRNQAHPKSSYSKPLPAESVSSSDMSFPSSPQSHLQQQVVKAGDYVMVKWKNDIEYLARVEKVNHTSNAPLGYKYVIRFIIDNVSDVVVPSRVRKISRERANEIMTKLNEPLPEEEVIYDPTLKHFQDSCRARRRRQRESLPAEEIVPPPPPSTISATDDNYQQFSTNTPKENGSFESSVLQEPPRKKARKAPAVEKPEKPPAKNGFRRGRPRKTPLVEPSVVSDVSNYPNSEVPVSMNVEAPPSPEVSSIAISSSPRDTSSTPVTGDSSQGLVRKSPRSPKMKILSFRQPVRIQSKRLVQRVSPDSVENVPLEGVSGKLPSRKTSPSKKLPSSAGLPRHPSPKRQSKPTMSSPCNFPSGTETEFPATLPSPVLFVSSIPPSNDSSSSRPSLKLNIHMAPRNQSVNAAHHPDSNLTPLSPSSSVFSCGTASSEAMMKVPRSSPMPTALLHHPPAPCPVPTSNPQRFMCSTCTDKSFRTQRQLDAHMRHYHSMEDWDSTTYSGYDTHSESGLATSFSKATTKRRSTKATPAASRSKGGREPTVNMSETASESNVDDNPLGGGLHGFSNSLGLNGASQSQSPPAHSLIYCPNCHCKDDVTTLIQCDSCLCWAHLSCYGLQKAPSRWECDACSRGHPNAPLRRSHLGVWHNHWASSGLLPGLQMDLVKENPVLLQHCLYFKQLLENVNTLFRMDKRRRVLLERYAVLKRRVPKKEPSPVKLIDHVQDMNIWDINYLTDTTPGIHPLDSLLSYIDGGSSTDTTPHKNLPVSSSLAVPQSHTEEVEVSGVVMESGGLELGDLDLEAFASHVDDVADVNGVVVVSHPFSHIANADTLLGVNQLPPLDCSDSGHHLVTSQETHSELLVGDISSSLVVVSSGDLTGVTTTVIDSLPPPRTEDLVHSGDVCSHVDAVDPLTADVHSVIDVPPLHDCLLSGFDDEDNGGMEVGQNLLPVTLTSSSVPPPSPPPTLTLHHPHDDPGTAAVVDVLNNDSAEREFELRLYQEMQGILEELHTIEETLKAMREVCGPEFSLERRANLVHALRSIRCDEEVNLQMHLVDGAASSSA